MSDEIKIIGARENNLKNITLSIPKNKLIVLTGVSGSGKSTIAFKTLQTECQRQYMESLGLVTDEFTKPNVDKITGLSPAISVSQNNQNRNPRSTVGTITEIYTYLRILFAKLGIRKCKYCHKEVFPDFENKEIGMDSSEDSFGENFEENILCPHCKKAIPLLTMSHFSFNKPQGACEVCNGIGTTAVPNLEKIINEELNIKEGAVLIWDDFMIHRNSESIDNAAKYYGFKLNINSPIKEWNQEAKTFLLYGALSKEIDNLFPNVKAPKTVPQGRYEGLLTNLNRKYKENNNIGTKSYEMIRSLFHEETCPKCNGTRLKKESAEVILENRNIIEISNLSLEKVLNFVENVKENISMNAMQIVLPVIQNLEERLNRFLDVGVGYLSMDRNATSLSGGEAQRLRLASLLGSGLTGVLYVLDEPTTGLHSKDTKKLIKVLYHLRDLGNTVLVIEHDIEVMNSADYIIDMGPGAGEYGGEVVAAGTLEEIIQNEKSLTGKYLSGKLEPYESSRKRKNIEKNIEVKNVNVNNLKNISVKIPIGKLSVISGVSGSGKSSLIFDVLGKQAENYFSKGKSYKNENLKGIEEFNRFITFDQNSIGKSSRSNVATYTDIYTDIRNLFSKLPEAKKQKLKPSHFSFNVAGGRCEKCEGAGVLTIPMHFMPDAEVICPMCGGKRFTKNILEVKYNDKNISDILNLTVSSAIDVFKEEKLIYEKLKFLETVGLSYLKLGQSTSTLSGGEAGRIKLSKELGISYAGNTLYLLDEPTTGLHPDDTVKLAKVLDELCISGNTVIVIEHNLDIIKIADYIIDFGPEGGENGGYILANGSVNDIINCKESATGNCLRKLNM